MLKTRRIVWRAGLIVCLFLWITTTVSGQGFNDIKSLVLAGEFKKAQERFQLHGTHDWRSVYFGMTASSLDASFNPSNSILKNHKEFYSGIDLLLDSLRAAPEQLLFLRAEWHLQQAIINARYEKEWDAFVHFRQAVGIVKEGRNIYPLFQPLKKTEGLVQVIIGAVPENYQWLLQLFGWKGSVPQGLKILREVYNDIDFREEARIFGYLTEAFVLEEIDNACQGMEILFKDESSELLRFTYMTVLSKASRGEDIIRISSTQSKLSQTLYISGEAYLQKGSYDSALIFFNNFLRESKGQELHKDTYFKMALCYKWKGELTSYDEMLSRSVLSPTTRLDADRNANELIKNGWDDNLLKCRLATDGGFYDAANDWLDKFWESRPGARLSPKKEIEIYAHYRQARIWHKSGSKDKAMQAYLTVVENSSYSDGHYYAPNSALILGRIYLDSQNTEKAEYWLNEVLKYRNHEYKRSLDKKAKALLAVIQK